jgi:hypothetical protein
MLPGDQRRVTLPQWLKQSIRWHVISMGQAVPTPISVTPSKWYIRKALYVLEAQPLDSSLLNKLASRRLWCPLSLWAFLQQVQNRELLQTLPTKNSSFWNLPSAHDWQNITSCPHAKKKYLKGPDLFSQRQWRVNLDLRGNKWVKSIRKLKID